MGLRDSVLERKALEMLSFIVVTDCSDEVGAWIKRYGDRFPLEQFKAKHFNHRRAYEIGKKLD